MTNRTIFVCLIIIISAAISLVRSSTDNNGDDGRNSAAALANRHPENTGVECKDDRMKFMGILKQVFDQEENCVPCPDYSRIAKRKLVAMEEKFRQHQRRTLELMASGNLIFL